jgi:hypothetical protein
MAAIRSEVRKPADRVLLTWRTSPDRPPLTTGSSSTPTARPRRGDPPAQVEALGASFRFTPAPTPIATDPAVVQAVARKALAALETDPAYACFPDEAGASRPATVTSMPPGPALAHPVPVTCSASIEPTASASGTSVSIAWTAGGSRKAGSNVTTGWGWPPTARSLRLRTAGTTRAAERDGVPGNPEPAMAEYLPSAHTSAGAGVDALYRPLALRETTSEVVS